MQTVENNGVSEDSVNYEESPIAEVALDGVEYRVDTGLGSAVAISRRQEGTWSWTDVLEGRWDGSRLRAKGLDYDVVTALGQALGVAMRIREDSD